MSQSSLVWRCSACGAVFATDDAAIDHADGAHPELTFDDAKAALETVPAGEVERSQAAPRVSPTAEMRSLPSWMRPIIFVVSLGALGWIVAPMFAPDCGVFIENGDRIGGAVQGVILAATWQAVAAAIWFGIRRLQKRQTSYADAFFSYPILAVSFVVVTLGATGAIANMKEECGVTAVPAAGLSG